MARPNNPLHVVFGNVIVPAFTLEQQGLTLEQIPVAYREAQRLLDVSLQPQLMDLNARPESVSTPSWPPPLKGWEKLKYRTQLISLFAATAAAYLASYYLAKNTPTAAHAVVQFVSVHNPLRAGPTPR